MCNVGLPQCNIQMNTNQRARHGGLTIQLRHVRASHLQCHRHLSQTWTWIHFLRPNATRPTIWWTQPNPLNRLNDKISDNFSQNKRCYTSTISFVNKLVVTYYGFIFFQSEILITLARRSPWHKFKSFHFLYRQSCYWHESSYSQQIKSLDLTGAN